MRESRTLGSVGAKAEWLSYPTVGFDLTLDFGVSRTAGFFVDTSASKELDVGFQVSLSNNFDARGELAFLHLDATNSQTSPTNFSGGFAVDLHAPGNRITLDALTSGAVNPGNMISADLTAEAHVHLQLDLTFDGKIDPTPSPLPSLRAQFALDWNFTPATGFAGSVPSIAFNDIQLRLGHFLDQFVKPIVKAVHDVIDPIKPVFDFLTDPIPVVSQLADLVGQGPVTIVKLAVQVFPFLKPIDVVFDVIKPLESVNLDATGTFVSLGSFDLGSADVRHLDDLTGLTPNITSSVSDLLAQVEEKAKALAQQIGGPVPGLVDDAFKALHDLQNQGLHFKLFENPTSLFGLILGKHVDLVTFDLGSSGQTVKFPGFGDDAPSLGPLSIKVGGSVDVFAHLSMGFDTAGIEKFASGGSVDDIFLEGFWIKDVDNNNVDVPELSLKGRFGASAGLKFFVLDSGVFGGFTANLDLNLNDPNHDGIVRLSEIKTLLETDPICLFDAKGNLNAELNAFIKVGIDPPIGPEIIFYQDSITFAKVVLFDFSNDCKPVTDPNLATLAGGILTLNLGPSNTRNVERTERNEVYQLSLDDHGTDDTSDDEIIVAAFMQTQRFKLSAVQGITGNAADGNDQILVDPRIMVPVTLHGGTGNDVLQGGGGADSLFGDDNDDVLIGNGGNDTLDGGANNDHLYGGAGNDSLVGGADNDTLQGDEGDDTLQGGTGDDVAVGGAGKDRLEGGDGNDRLDGGDDSDTLLGGNQNDLLFAGAGNDSLEGNAGDDTLSGGDGNDSMIGGAGNDRMFGDAGADIIIADDGAISGTNVTLSGGTGDDTVIGGDGADRLYGEGGNDAMAGDNATLDNNLQLVLLAGGADPDTVFGGDGNDLLFGQGGNDVIEGGNDKDTVFGGDGNDRLIGGRSDGVATNDDDVVFGEGGDDIILGDSGIIGSITLLGGAGDDSLVGGAGADLIYGQGGNDTLEGGTQDDTLVGGAGNDIVTGQDDNDSLEGGAGADFVFGGSGNDDMIGGLGALSTVSDGPDLGDFMIGDAGNDVMLGDNGTITAGTRFVTTDASNGGGVDFIFGGNGDDTIFGEGFGDFLFGDLSGGTGNDIVVGDQGSTTATQIVALHSVTPNSAGDDFISGGGGNDTLLGGDGADTLDGNAGQDVILGDNGAMTFAGGVVQQIATTAGGGGKDTITGGSEADTALGGDDSDTIDGAAAPDILVGDNGQIDYLGGIVALIQTTDSSNTTGGDDEITGGPDDDVILGGVGSDKLTGDQGSDIILGDNGFLDYNKGANGDLFLDEIATRDFAIGSSDSISGGADKDIVFGGTAGDTIFGDDSLLGVPDAAPGDDVLVGDQGHVLFTHVGTLNLRSRIETLDTAEGDGGVDTIKGNEGKDIILGGVKGDLLSGNAGDDIVLGDDGALRFDVDADLTTLDLIQSQTDANLGGTDTISGNAGADVAIGGTAGDLIYGDDATPSAAASDLRDILLGDNGEIRLLPLANFPGTGLDAITILGGTVQTIRATDVIAATGGNDTISGNAKGDIIVGGVQGDFLYGDGATPTAATTVLDGNDIILGDNGALEWLSTGRLSEVTGIDIAANNPALFAKYGTGVADTDLTTLDLITTEQPTSGGRDVIYGDEGKDLLFGGTDSDTMYGDDGNQTGTPTNNDLMFGDHGRVYPQFSTLSGFNSRNFFAIDIGNPITGDAAGGEGDQMWGEEGADVMLGQQGDDQMFGGSEDDDMIGGHNVAGGVDERANPVVNATLNPAMNDLMDGGSGNDAMAGDSATIWRRGDDLSARFRQLTAPTIYTTSNSAIGVNVSAAMQSDPDDSVGRDITMLDHSFAAQANPFRYGNDVMVGGPGKDVMFGELGDDLMQGDGSLDGPSGTALSAPNPASRSITVTDSGSLPPSTLYYLFNVREQASDSDDYMEGNGGNDLMYGDLGQDDMIGGSSSLFGLGTIDPSSANLRPDGSDTMFGGAGIDIGRNDIGDATVDSSGNIITGSTGHARDADYMMGDNANIFRLVKGGASGTNSADPNDVFLSFGYDNYAGGLRIIPRASQPLDYTLGGADYKNTDSSNTTPWNYVNGAAGTANNSYRDNGAADVMHGESGDDVIFGMTGSDVLFGEGQDDDIIGGYGNDWISGGTGQDGVLGDDGLIYTSRNGTAEPLNGIAATTQQTISTPGQIQYAVINTTGDLKKTIELIPFSYDHRWNGTDDEFPNNADNTPYADDIIFGGLGSDFLHGGSGDDAISGAEALDHAYVPTYDANGNPTGIQDLGYAVAGSTLPPINPGNVLAFNPLDLDGRHLNNRFRAGEFALYDEYDPLREVQLDSQGNLWKSSAQGTPYEFLLNFNKDEGVVRPGGTVPKATGQQTDTYGPVNDDGADALFGDLGNDWLVGGTGRDDMYGGWGNDLINADDDPTTNGSLNDQPDTHPTYEDRAYGGAGRDVLIANTGGDRLIDWVGEYNTYLVPYAPFGEASVSRTLQPQLQEFLYALSKADGADQTQARDTGADSLRNGEPAAELGLVLQKDFAWQDQTGAPSDPQAGNIPGGKRDVLRSADFNDGQAQAFFADSGSWTVSSGRYQVAPSVAGGDAVSVFYVDSYVPTYFEMLATINAVKPTGGSNANAYLVFDYQSPTNFKFAGINVSTNKLEIGHRNAQGWIVDTQAAFPGTIKSATDYNLFLSLNGSAVTLVVNNQVTLAFTFAPRVDAYGISHGLNDGMVGLGAKNASAQIDNVTVQRVAPVTTFSQTVDFGSTTTSLFQAPLSGTWSLAGGRYAGTAGATAPAIDLTAINVTSYSLIDLSGTLKTTGAGGFVYDEYSATDFKFVTISAGQVTLGHRTAKGWFTDATYSNAALTPVSTDYTLGLTLKGTTVSVTLNNQVVLSRVYNALVTDGDFGLFSRTGTTSFDTVTVKSDAPNLLNQAFALTAESAPSGAVDPTSPLTETQLAGVAQVAIRDWSAAVGTGAAGALNQVNFVLVNDLPGNAVAWSIGDGTILIDMNAAGYGWFVDPTPYDSGEFHSSNGALAASRGSDAYGHMDLLTAVAHEVGHVLGFEHGEGTNGNVMASTLAPGERHLDGAGLAAVSTTSAGNRHGSDRLVVDWDAEMGGLLDGASRPYGAATAKAGLKPLFPAFEYTAIEGSEAGRRAWAPASREEDGGAEGVPTAALLPSTGWEWRVEVAASGGVNRGEGEDVL